MKLTSITDPWGISETRINAIATFSDGKQYRFIIAKGGKVERMAFPHVPSKNENHQTWDWGTCGKNRIFPARARAIEESPLLDAAFQDGAEEHRKRKEKDRVEDKQKRLEGINAKRIQDQAHTARNLILSIHSGTAVHLLKSDIARYIEATRPLGIAEIED